MLEACEQINDTAVVEPIQVLVNRVDKVRQELAHHLVIVFSEEALRNANLQAAHQVIKMIRSQLVHLHVLDVSHERLESLLVLR